MILAGDLNRHVGQSREGIKRWHGGWGIGEKNSEGQRILDCMILQDMVVLNTFFEKRRNQLITYNSGGRMSQIDFLVCRRANLKDIRDCQVVNGESKATQHQLVMLSMRGTILKKSKTKRVRKIWWWKLNNVGLRAEFKQKVLENWKQTEGVQEWWSVNSKILLKAAEEVLGKTSGKKAPQIKKQGGGMRRSSK